VAPHLREQMNMPFGDRQMPSGLSAFTREDLVCICKKRFAKSLHVTSMGRILRETRAFATKGETQSNVPDPKVSTR
jgi:hypothetical protein